MTQVADVGVHYVLCGHSERRNLFGEGDELVGRKVQAVVAHGITPILCVGETLTERQRGQAWEVVARQLRHGVATVGDVPAGLVIAYEPVWAIGTGVAAQPSDAQAMAARIRVWLRERFGGPGDRVRIQYGGSVNTDNAGGFLSLPDVDGALVGGASLDPDTFWAIARSAHR